MSKSQRVIDSLSDRMVDLEPRFVERSKGDVYLVESGKHEYSPDDPTRNLLLYPVGTSIQ
jgi:hypothetical protein